MRAAGTSEAGMHNDLAANKFDGQLKQGLAAPMVDEQGRKQVAETRSEAQSFMGRAAESVADYKLMRSTDDLPAGRTVESFKRDAQNAIGAAWDQPEAAKAMRAAGASQDGMQRELAAGKLDGQIRQGLTAPVAAPQDDKQADAWNKVEAAGRTARQEEGAQGSKVSAKTSTDDADKAKKRQGMTA